MNEDKLIEENRGLVKNIVCQFKPRNITEVEEFEQAGLIGLMKAIRKYDASKGKLSTIAFYYINGEITKYIRQEKNYRYSSSGLDSIVQPTHINVSEYLGTLSITEKNIIDLFLDGYSFTEIGDKFGHNRSWASRIYKDLVKKIRKNYDTSRSN